MWHQWSPTYCSGTNWEGRLYIQMIVCLHLLAKKAPVPLFHVHISLCKCDFPHDTHPSLGVVYPWIQAKPVILKVVTAPIHNFAGINQAHFYCHKAGEQASLKTLTSTSEKKANRYFMSDDKKIVIKESDHFSSMATNDCVWANLVMFCISCAYLSVIRYSSYHTAADNYWETILTITLQSGINIL